MDAGKPPGFVFPKRTLLEDRGERNLGTAVKRNSGNGLEKKSGTSKPQLIPPIALLLRFY